MSDLMESGKSGPTSPKRQCTSKAKGTGDRCKRSPVPGAEVCVVHGGAAPQVKAKAAERLLTARIRGELAKVEIEPITDPAAAYADLAGEQWAFKELARQQIQVLESWASWSEGAGEQIKASVQVYTAALTAMQKTLADMLRIGLSAEALRAAKERPSREQAEALQRVIDGLLGGLDLSAEQRAKVPAALTEAVRREGLL